MSTLSRVDNLHHFDFNELSLLSFIRFITEKFESDCLFLIINSLEFVSVRLIRETPVNL